jgi:hypothetical protein
MSIENLELSTVDPCQGFDNKSIEHSVLDSSSKQASFNNLMVGPPGFEPESIEPKSTSLDQASRWPPDSLTEPDSEFLRTMSDFSETMNPIDPLLLLATPNNSLETFKFSPLSYS